MEWAAHPYPTLQIIREVLIRIWQDFLFLFLYVRNRCVFVWGLYGVTWATEGSAGIVAALGLVWYLSRVAVKVQVCREAAGLDGHKVSSDTCMSKRLTFLSGTLPRLKELSVLRLAKIIPSIYHCLPRVTVFSFPVFHLHIHFHFILSLLLTHSILFRLLTRLSRMECCPFVK